MNKRHEPLDWLRGLMAVSVMLFHLALFGYMGTRPAAASVLGKMGIYAVAVFYVLSGLSMAHSYHSFTGGVASFYVRRIFRIWPLLWVVVLIAAGPLLLSGKSATLADGTPIDGWLVFLNMTTLFAFVAPAHAINTGAWSIGNEMVYYVLTPALLLFYRRSLVLGNAITLLSVFVGVVFAFVVLSPADSLEAQWALYVNPLNSLFLYCCGIAIFFNRGGSGRRWWFLLPAAAFALWPVDGEEVNLVVGSTRMGMSALVVAVVWCFYHCPPALPHWLGTRLRQLGEATYGVYLLHRIVMYWTARVFSRLDVSLALVAPVVIVVTIMLAWISWQRFEKPLANLAKRVRLPLLGQLAVK